jgi:hypothetical protein
MRRLTAGVALGACAPEKKARAIWLNAPCLRSCGLERGGGVRGWGVIVDGLPKTRESDLRRSHGLRFAWC